MYDSVEALLDDPGVEVLDIAVPPQAQPGILRRALEHPRRPRGILAQKPVATAPEDARELITACDRGGAVLQVDRNMRYDQSVRALKELLDRGALVEAVLATIVMHAIPHWIPWAEGGRSLSTYT